MTTTTRSGLRELPAKWRKAAAALDAAELRSVADMARAECYRSRADELEAALTSREAGEREAVVWQRRHKLGDWHEVGRELYEHSKNDPVLTKHYEYRALYAAPPPVAGEDLASIPDGELPGMWERADFMGGAEEVRPAAPPPPVDGMGECPRYRLDVEGTYASWRVIPVRDPMGEWCKYHEAKRAAWLDNFAAPVAAAQPAEGVDGPDDPDGCDHEGFPGGCARLGCDAELQQMLDWLAANEGDTANLPFLADNLRDEGRPERGDMVRAANTFIDRQEEVIRWLLKHPNPPAALHPTSGGSNEG